MTSHPPVGVTKKIEFDFKRLEADLLVCPELLAIAHYNQERKGWSISFAGGPPLYVTQGKIINLNTGVSLEPEAEVVICVSGSHSCEVLAGWVLEEVAKTWLPESLRSDFEFLRKNLTNPSEVTLLPWNSHIWEFNLPKQKTYFRIDYTRSTRDYHLLYLKQGVGVTTLFGINRVGEYQLVYSGKKVVELYKQGVLEASLPFEGPIFYEQNCRSFHRLVAPLLSFSLSTPTDICNNPHEVISYTFGGVCLSSGVQHSLHYGKGRGLEEHLRRELGEEGELVLYPSHDSLVGRNIKEFYQLQPTTGITIVGYALLFPGEQALVTWVEVSKSGEPVGATSILLSLL